MTEQDNETNDDFWPEDDQGYYDDWGDWTPNWEEDHWEEDYNYDHPWHSVSAASADWWDPNTGDQYTWVTMPEEQEATGSDAAPADRATSSSSLTDADTSKIIAAMRAAAGNHSASASTTTHARVEPPPGINAATIATAKQPARPQASTALARPQLGPRSTHWTMMMSSERPLQVLDLTLQEELLRQLVDLDRERTIDECIQLLSSIGAPDWLLSDSGASAHSCPLNYATEFALRDDPETMATCPWLRSVTGDDIKVYGRRTVYYQLTDDMTASLDYIVTDAIMPVVSNSQLSASGYTSTYGPDGDHISKGNNVFPLHKESTLYYVRPIRRLSEDFFLDKPLQASLPTADAPPNTRTLTRKLTRRRKKKNKSQLYTIAEDSDAPPTLISSSESGGERTNKIPGNDEDSSEEEPNPQLEELHAFFKLPYQPDVPIPMPTSTSSSCDSLSEIQQLIAAEGDLTEFQTRNSASIDCWEVRGDYLIRIHHRKRKRLFKPTDCSTEQLPEGVTYDFISPTRVSKIHYEDATREDKRDEWHSTESGLSLGRHWTGETWFKLLTGSTDLGGADEDTTTDLRPVTANEESEIETRLRQDVIAAHHFRIGGELRTTDFWSKHGQLWVRHHVVPRTTLYVPETDEGGPDVTKLDDLRKTYLLYINPETSEEEPGHINDKWRLVLETTPATMAGRPDIELVFTGTTTFTEPLELNPRSSTITVKDDTHSDSLPRPTSQAQQARTVTSPKNPTTQERALHDLTHLPFRSWCQFCQETKSKDDHHKKQTKENVNQSYSLTTASSQTQLKTNLYSPFLY